MPDTSPAAPPDLLGARRPAGGGDARSGRASPTSTGAGSPSPSTATRRSAWPPACTTRACGPGTVVELAAADGHRHARAARRADPARRGAEPDRPDHARARGALHHQRGEDRVLHRAATSGAASPTARWRDEIAGEIGCTVLASDTLPTGDPSALPPPPGPSGSGAGCTTRRDRPPTPRARGTPTRRSSRACTRSSPGSSRPPDDVYPICFPVAHIGGAAMLVRRAARRVPACPWWRRSTPSALADLHGRAGRHAPRHRAADVPGLPRRAARARRRAALPAPARVRRWRRAQAGRASTT